MDNFSYFLGHCIRCKEFMVVPPNGVMASCSCEGLTVDHTEYSTKLMGIPANLEINSDTPIIVKATWVCGSCKQKLVFYNAQMYGDDRKLLQKTCNCKKTSATYEGYVELVKTDYFEIV